MLHVSAFASGQWLLSSFAMVVYHALTPEYPRAVSLSIGVSNVVGGLAIANGVLNPDAPICSFITCLVGWALLKSELVHLSAALSPVWLAERCMCLLLPQGTGCSPVSPWLSTML